MDPGQVVAAVGSAEGLQCGDQVQAGGLDERESGGGGGGAADRGRDGGGQWIRQRDQV